MKSLSQAIVSLFESEMFYAELVSQMRRVIDPTMPAAAGVCIRGGGVELHINPHGLDVPLEDGKTHHIPGWEEQTLKQQVALLKHECGHILNEHIPRAKDLAPEMFVKDQDIVDQIINSAKHKELNVAMDLALNPAIPDLPEWGCFPKNFDLPDGQTFEWYHEHLHNEKKAKQKLQNMTGFDPHALWKETTDTKEVIKEKIRQAVNQAAQNTRAAGRMTANDELLVEGFNKSASINWAAQMRRFVAKQVSAKIEASRKRRNRRYGIHIPGNIKIEELHIGVARDTSGSCWDQQVVFMQEIKEMSKYCRITLIDADTEVKQVINNFDPKKSNMAKGCGGTAYKPAFDYFNNLKTVDAMIYFGDMDTFDREVLEKPKYPVLWAIVGNQEPPANFGAQVRVKYEG